MTENYSFDVLTELSYDNLNELAKMYSKHRESLPHIYSFLRNCLKSKEIGLKDFVTVYSANGSWRKDGTFIAYMPDHGTDVVLHSLDSSGKSLIEGLSATNKIHYKKNSARDYTLFYGVHETIFPQVLDALRDRLKRDLQIDETHLWCLRKERALNFNINDDLRYQSEVYVKKLQLTNLPTINRVWPKRYPEGVKKLGQLLNLQDGFGVYLKSNNQLVSWVTASCLGQMTALQTLEEFQNKGYAKLAVKSMAKHLAEKGFDACGTVMTGNVPSERLFERLGFEKLYKCYYIEAVE